MKKKRENTKLTSTPPSSSNTPSRLSIASSSIYQGQRRYRGQRIVDYIEPDERSCWARTVADLYVLSTVTVNSTADSI